MKLSQYLEANGISQAEFARQVGTTRQNVGRWVGSVVPRPAEMMRIALLTGGAVTANDFFAEQPAPAPAKKKGAAA